MATNWVSRRLDSPPTILRGCTLAELVSLVIGALFVCIPSMVLFMGLFGYALMGIGVGVIVSVMVTYALATILQVFKRGRPLGYYQSRIVLLLSRFGLRPRDFIDDQTRVWSVGRLRCRTFSTTQAE